MRLFSSAFADHDAIPRKYSCDGEDLSPPLAWSDVPPGAQETWGMQVEKRGWTQYRTANIVERLAELIERKVNLKSPHKRVRIDVVGSAVAVSLLRPGEVFSIHAFDVAQTEPAAAG